MPFRTQVGLLLAAVLLLFPLLAPPAVVAQSPPVPPETCETDLSAPLATGNGGGKALTRLAAEDVSSSPTPAEARLQEMLAPEGVHVVRFWAPWCANSTNEMNGGWTQLVEDNPEVNFIFVTVWNNGRSGAGTLLRRGLSLKRVTEVVPEKPDQGRIDIFLGYSVDWLPSTWVFRSDGEGNFERAFALNYGEMDRTTLQTLIRTAQAEW